MNNERPYFFENMKYNRDTSSYVKDFDNIWVTGIYKKTLVSLGIKIYRSELGGRIGYYNITAWCFLIKKEDKAKIEVVE
jgi:hypothetical protein